MSVFLGGEREKGEGVGMSEVVSLSRFEPEVRMMCVDGWEWEGTSRLLSRTSGVEYGAMMCGDRGLRGGVHAFEWVVRCPLRGREVGGKRRRGYVEMEFGAVEVGRVATLRESVRRGSRGRRVVHVEVRDGDVVNVVLDLVRGWVVVMVNGLIVQTGRENPLGRICDRIMDSGYVTPMVIACIGTVVELEVVSEGTVAYSLERVERFLRERDALVKERGIMVKKATRTAKQTIYISSEVIKGDVGADIVANVGDLVVFDAYENAFSNAFWEFEISGCTAEDQGDDILLYNSDPDDSFFDLFRAWGHFSSSATSSFLCGKRGSAKIHFGYVPTDSLDRELDNFITVVVTDPPPPEISYSRCGVS